MKMAPTLLLMTSITWTVLSAPPEDPPAGTNVDITDTWFEIADEDGFCIDQGTVEARVDNQTGGTLYAKVHVWDHLPLPGENHTIHEVDIIQCPPGVSNIEATWLAEEGGEIPLQEEYDVQVSLWTWDPETEQYSPYPNFNGLLLSRRTAFWRE